MRCGEDMVDVTTEHPRYTARKAMWSVYRDLYEGGERFRANATQYLVPRHKEPAQVYHERLERAYYENYIGSIIDWFAATLFRREPMLSFSGGDGPGRRFFCEFTEDCDRRQSNLSDFFRRRLVDALVAGGSYILVDFPRAERPPANRAEEDAWGVSRAYLVPYSAEELINWSEDEDGAYEWVVLRTTRLRQEEKGPVTEVWWRYFDRENYKVFRGVQRGGRVTPEPAGEGRHALAELGRVPLFSLDLTDGLWLMNRAAQLQLEHFNKSNALGWALTMGLFAMPVIYSRREFRQMIGESYYIQLEPEDKFGWTEPEGHVYQIAVDNLTRLKDEIYRVCYLMPQARNSDAPASGLSKQRDFTTTQEVLRAYGDLVKDTMKRVLRSIAAARRDDLVVDVSGLDEFDIGDFTTELEDARKLLALGIPSDTLKKEIFKKLVHKYLCDARQEIKDRVSEEIERGFQAA